MYVLMSISNIHFGKRDISVHTKIDIVCCFTASKTMSS